MLSYNKQKGASVPKLTETKPASKLKVLAIAGSPRRDGNTDLLLHQVIAGASSQGAKTKTVMLSELNISPCRHCDGCLKTGKCVIDDDMQWLYTDLRDVDRVVLASPIFFMGVTAQTKAMIDRCQSLWARKYVLKQAPPGTRRGAFIAVGATQGERLFDGARLTVQYFFKALSVAYSDELLIRGVDQKGDIRKHATTLKDAFELGRRLVRN